MRFNGIELREMHPALSVAKEIPPGMPTRTNHMVEGADGETLVNTSMQRGQYVVYVNIAGKTRQEAWEARARLAQWATSSGNKTAPLEPEYWPGMAYNAVISEIEPPEFKFGFRKIKVTFEVPRPVPYELKVSRSSGNGALTMAIGGTRECRPVIAQIMDAAADQLTWAMDGKTIFTLDAPLQVGDQVEASFAEGWVTINGEHAEDKIDYNATWWQPGFKPGMKAITSSDGGYIEARWHNEWA